MKKNFILCTFLIGVFNGKIFSQHSLYISPGANFNISSGTYVFVNGIEINPSANYNIPGENSFVKNVIATVSPPTGYIQRVYYFLQNLPAFSGTITIYYQDSELNGLDENSLNLNLYDGVAWQDYAASSRDGVNNFVTTSSLMNVVFREATLAADASLPVTLSGFTVQSTRCIVTLKWITETEQNSSHFEVQHSTDGVRYTVTGIVPAAGSSIIQQHYSFTLNISSPHNFFRLRMVDSDGTSEFSPVVRVHDNCNTSIVRLFPNPASDKITINGYKEIDQIKLFNDLGQVVKTINAAGHSVSVDLSRLPAGIYVVHVLSDNRTHNLKLIKE